MLSGIKAIMMIEGAVDGAVFEAFLKERLVPTVHHGDIILMDNLKVHKGEEVEKIIHSAGAKLQYLPRYSPDFSPLEN